MTNNPTPILFSLSESARLFGVSQRTLRRAIAADELKAMVVQGRYKVAFHDLLRWSEESSRTQQKRDSSGIGQYVSQWRMPSGDVQTAPVVQTSSPAQPEVFKVANEKKARVKKPSAAQAPATQATAATAAAQPPVVLQPVPPAAPQVAAPVNQPAPQEPTLNWD